MISLEYFDGTVTFIDAATLEPVGPTLRFDGQASSVSATRDGALIVVTAPSDAGFVTTVHDGTTGEQVGPSLTGPEMTGVSLDGILVGATNGDITRYDLATMEPIAQLPGARGDVNTLRFSDDGSMLIATSLDQTVSVYDVATGTRLGDPIPADAPFIIPGFLRHDGREVAVTVEQGIALWDLDPERLRAAACRLAGRNLTPTEWATFLGGLGEYRPTCLEHA